MKTFSIVITNAVGLHARPAAAFVQAAQSFQSDIVVISGDRRANAKSILAVLALGVKTGTSVTVAIDGADEEDAARALKEVAQEHVGAVAAVP